MLRAAGRVLVVIACLAAPGVSYAQAPMTIRVYDSTGRSARERAVAIATAAAIFADAGLRLVWRDCGRTGADHPCAPRRQPDDLVVRIVHRPIASDPAASNAVTADASAFTEREAAAQLSLRLGFAALDDRARSGVVATVFSEHVRDVTERTGVRFAQLLGRAIAHEVGHLFPGGDHHSPTGLMRAVWTDGELRRNQAEDWAFTPNDVSVSARPRTPRSR
jgi:hypothetical protein